MKHLKPLSWALAPLALVAALLLFAANALPAAAAPNGGTISGTVTSPNGYPLPAGTVVKLFDPFDESVRGKAFPDLNDGSFSLGPVPNGLYVIKAVPPDGSSLTQSLPTPVSVANNPVDVGGLALTTPQISGAVTAPDGLTPADADVIVYAGDGQVFQRVDATGGDFLIGGLPAGSYFLQAKPTGNDPYWNSAEVTLAITDATSATLSLALTDAQIWGYVEDHLGNPVPYATIMVANGSGDYQTDLSNADGFWAIGGLPDGTYWMTALPPLQNIGLLPPTPVSVTLPGASNPYTLTFDAPPKTVTGTVSTNTGVAVQNARVTAQRVGLPGFVETLSAADGSYQLGLSSGLWALTVEAISTTVPADWVYPQPRQLVYFQFDNLPQSTTQDFLVITSDATASGYVEMPDGSTPPFTVTVGLYNGEGVGAATEINPADGSFSLSLPNGNYDVLVSPHDAGYLGPAVDPANLPPNGSVDLGTITLLPRDALITGTLTADGVPVEGVPLIAWRPGVPGSVHTASGPGGVYALAVTTGTWQIQPAPGPEQPYLYTGSGQTLDITAGQVVSGVDFDLLSADATISGVLVDEDGNPVTDVQGWAAAAQTGNPAIHNGAPILGGGFTIYVPAGTYNVAAHLPNGSPYMSAAERQVSVSAGERVTLTLTVQEKDAAIAGALWDPRNQDVVSGVPGWVGAWDGSSWTAAAINPGNGAYYMPVAAGVWHVNYRIDQSEYAKAGGHRNVAVQSGQTAVVPLPVVPKDAAIEGTVLDPNGNPLPGATVVVKGLGSEVQNLRLHTQSAADGSFRIELPYGRYRLGATLGPDSGWINPIEKTVTVDPNSVSGGHVLQFQQPDAVLRGTLTVTNTTEAGMVYVWAWSEDGGFTNGHFPVSQAGGYATGAYSLEVVSGTVWRVGAVFETGSQYWKGHETVEVNTADVVQDITLMGSQPKPGPVVVTFDAANPQRIRLADGTEIFIPAGAMPVSGLVTLRIVPIATLPQHFQASVLTYGYAFFATDASGLPIESNFNQDVIIRFAYDEDALHGFPEILLKPAYFSTTTNQWTVPESYVVDTEANLVTIQIDHFTNFALISEGGSVVYLPVIVR